MVAAGRVNGRGSIRAAGGLVYPDMGNRYGEPTIPTTFLASNQGSPQGAGQPGERNAKLHDLLDWLTRSDRRWRREDTHDAGGDARYSTPTGKVDGARRVGAIPGTEYAQYAQSPEVVEGLGPQRVTTWQDDAGERHGAPDYRGIDDGPAPYRVQRPYYTGTRAWGALNATGGTDVSYYRLRLRPMMLAANVAPGQATRRRSVSHQSPSTGSTARIPAVRVPVSSVSERRTG